MQSPPNLRTLNLNFLPVLREILRQKSVSKAAQAINLSQPAISNILKILREHFDDELLARDGRSMRLTLKAEQLLGSLEMALHHIETVVSGDDFNLATVTGPVNIATVDNVIGALAGPMSKLLSREAPNLQMQFLHANRRFAQDLRAGTLDIVITSTVMLESGVFDDAARSELHSQTLADEPLVCIGRADDVDLSAGLSLEAYLARPHASYIVDPEQHHTIERQMLAELGLSQQTRISTASNLSLPSIVAEGGCLALVPETLARTAMKQYPIQISAPPLAVPDIRWVIVWHERSDASPLVRWAIDAFARCAGVFFGDTKGGALASKKTATDWDI